MHKSLLELQIEQEQRLGSEAFQAGVALRVLSGDDLYSDTQIEMESKLTRDASAIASVLAQPNAKRQALETLALVQQTLPRLEAGELLQTIPKELQLLLPFDFQNINSILGPEAVYQELLYQQLKLSLIVLCNTYFVGTVQMQAGQIAGLGKAYFRVLSNLQISLADLLVTNQQIQADVLDPSLALIVATKSEQEIQQALRSWSLEANNANEDVASFCSSLLCPLHFMPDLILSINLPGSIVWSQASLLTFLEATKFPAIASVPLSQILIAWKKNPETPLKPSDAFLQQAFFLGLDTLREYYRTSPPNKPVWQTNKETSAPLPAANQPAPDPTQQQATGVASIPVRTAPSVPPAAEPIPAAAQPITTPGSAPQPAEQPGATVDFRHPDQSPPSAGNPDDQSKIKPLGIQ